MLQEQETKAASRKNNLFQYENSDGEVAYFTHSELIALRTAYVESFPDMSEEVYADETIFNHKAESSLRQQMAEWNEDR